MKSLFRLSVLYLLLSLIGSPAQARLISKNITYHDPNRTPLKGMIVYDDAITGKRPGVLVVHEWWGMNDYARKRAKMLAKLGYTALALDMYGNGLTASHPKDAGAFAGKIGKNLPLARARFEAALTVLKQHPTVDAKKTAAIGYCFGGGIVLQMARLGVDLKGVASFHGSLGSQIRAKKGQIKAAVRVFNGEDDPFTTPEQIKAFKQEMQQADVDFRFYNYPGAKHSFTNPEADTFGKRFDLPLAYNKKADEASWQAMKDFFREIFAN